jgi:enoyl-CoA hydratase/carnithine racemase
VNTPPDLVGDVLVVTLDNPPVNSLSIGLRHMVLAALQRAQADAQVRAVLIIGANEIFCGGADLRAVNTPEYWSYPRTIELGTVFDAMSKPVIAAIGGLAMGGGLELAMACHWRVAMPDARLALPEIKLGLLPGGGGTIRLPRLVGVQAATEMMLGGEPVDGRRARDLGLVDVLAPGKLLDAALEFTRAVLARGGGLRRARDLPARLAAEPSSWFADQRRELARRGVQGPAAATILRCIEAGVTLPIEEASKVSDAGTRALMESVESKALRYLFFAERQAGKTGAPASESRRHIQRVALVGKGHLSDHLEAMLGAAGLTVASAEPQLVLATSAAPADDDAPLQALHRAVPLGVPFATTGDFADWQRLQAMLPGRTVVALRFGAVRAVELVREPGADASTLDAIARLVRKLGKVCVPCAPAAGFLIQRLQDALAREVQALAAAGHRQPDVDAALRQFGFEGGVAGEPLPGASDIVQRCVAAMAAEGQALLDAGIAVRPSDIDVALVAAAAFPAIRGGPMFWAAETGGGGATPVA